MELQRLFVAACPNGFFLDPSAPQALQSFLQQQGWLTPAQRIASVDKAGEGNMNLVLRVTLDDGLTRIIKQARPWVEKFPQVAAPVERAEVEAEFYRRTAGSESIARHSPRLLAMDSESKLQWLEDLGAGADLSALYAGQQTLAAETLQSLLDYLSALHRDFRRADCDFHIENRAMRALNGEHIFRFPFAADNGLDLDGVTPGLAEVAASVRSDAALQDAIRALEARYHADGDTLVHGDFFPGSVLHTARGLFVIDPEFCFFGDAEWDVGVWLAHMHLAQQPCSVTAAVFAGYAAGPDFMRSRALAYAGIEILRRILGLAQLPLVMDLASKQALVGLARQWLLGLE
ncbi:MAG: phosphotransferase [Oceanococcaceae bacterium]